MLVGLLPAFRRSRGSRRTAPDKSETGGIVNHRHNITVASLAAAARRPHRFQHALAVAGWALGSCALLASPATAQTAYTGSRTSSFTYYTAADGAKNGLIATETVEPDNPQLCTTTTHTYDSYGNKVSATTANCAGATGRALFAARAASSAYTAQPAQTITVNGTSYANVVAPAGAYPRTVSNALNQSETKRYDPRFGAVNQLIGPNGSTLATTWQLDDFGRKTRETRADGTSTVMAYCYIVRPVNDPLYIEPSSNSGASDPMACPTPAAGEAPPDAVAFVHSEPRNTGNSKMGPFVRVYSDRLGREVRSVTESFDATSQPSPGALVVKDTVYNSFGAKTLETQPYFLARGSSLTAGSNDVGAVSTSYDVLGRATTIYVADPNGSQVSGVVFGGASSTVAYGVYGNKRASRQLVAYNGLSTTTTNDKGQTRVEEKNLYGQVIRVTDANLAQVAFQYDAFENLVATKDALQNTITAQYNVRGHKVQMNDPDKGVWDYCYDALGQLKAQQNGNMRGAGATGQCPNVASTGKTATSVAGWTTLAYDALGRLTQRIEPEFTSTWSYDNYANGSACNKGIGKLCESSTSAFVSRKLVYDNLGRPLNTRTTANNGPSFASAVSYDLATGRLATQTYPTGLQVAYAYTGLGYLSEMRLAVGSTLNPLPATAGGPPGGSVTTAAGALLWQAQVANAWGKAEQFRYGNDIISRATFEAATGRTTDLKAGEGAGSLVLDHHYTWDSLNNLTGRTDANGDGGTGAVSETFIYGDNLNRLTQYTVAAPQIPGLSRNVTLQYNALGMLLYKSDVGAYTYGAAGGARPHTLASVAGAYAGTYQYDANGNLQTASAGKYRSVAYTSFDLPDSQSGMAGPNGTPRYVWQYDENHARLKEVRTIVGGTFAGTRTTWNLHPDNQGGLGFESEVNVPTTPSVANPAVTSNRHYLSVGGQVIGVMVSTGAVPTLSSAQTAPPVLSTITLVKTEYWHKDHLGSLAATTDHARNVTGRYAYDPFGKRRLTTGVYDATGSLVVDWSAAVNKGTDRGFTGHEHLDDVGLVHMNGRIFDPTLGVFLQADPMVQAPGNLQNYNRYAYCYNNPLTCTDPTGYFNMSDAMGVLDRSISLGGLLGGDPVGAYLTWRLNTGKYGYQAKSIGIGVGSAFCYGYAFVCNAVGQAALASAYGMSDEQALKVGFIAGATTGAFQVLGDVSPGWGQASADGTRKATETTIFWNTVGHAAIGCASAAASGGACAEGAISAGFAAAVGNGGGYSKNMILGTMQSAMVGGSLSVLSGGKFGSGAITAAFGYLYNELAHQTTAYERGYSNEPGDYRMYFDGIRLELYGPDGKLIDIFAGVSGATGYQTGEYQGLSNRGPLPEGTWKLGGMQYATNTDAAIGLLGKLVPPGKWGAWPGGTPAWGEYRVWLNPAEGTNTFGRSNFSIHGGWFAGSAGCIDLGADMRRFVNTMSRIKGDTTLYIKYR